MNDKIKIVAEMLNDEDLEIMIDALNYIVSDCQKNINYLNLHAHKEKFLDNLNFKNLIRMQLEKKQKAVKILSILNYYERKDMASN